MKPQTAASLAMLAAVPFVMVLGNSMLIPVLPKMQSVMDLSPVQVGLIITAFSLPAGLTIPFAGALSDRIGRKVVMVPALVLFGLGGLVAGAAAALLQSPFPALLGGRILQGVGAGGTYQLALALTADIFQSRERTKAVGLLEAANGLGKVVSPILGAAVALIAWFAPFFVYGLLALPVAAGVWFVVREPRTQAGGERSGERGQAGEPAGAWAPGGGPGTDRAASRPAGGLGRYLRGLAEVFREKGPAILTSYGVGMVSLFALFGVLAFLSDRLERPFGILGFRKGMVLAGPVGVMAVTAYLEGIFLQQRTALLKPTVLAGSTLSVASLAALAIPAVVNSLGWLLAASVFLGLGVGMVLPPLNTFVTSAAGRSARGAVTALYGSVRFLGVAVGPPFFGLTLGGARWPVFAIAAALAAIAGVLAALLVRPAQMTPGTSQAGRTAGQAESREQGEPAEEQDAGDAAAGGPARPPAAATGRDQGSAPDPSAPDQEPAPAWDPF